MSFGVVIDWLKIWTSCLLNVRGGYDMTQLTVSSKSVTW
jgi:hypothetical protein